MTRRTLFSMLAGATLALIALFATGSKASAQPIRLCPSGTYTVDLTPLAPLFPRCFPLQIYTSWAGLQWPNLLGWPGYTTPGIWTETPPVPVGAPLDWIRVCGIVIPPAPGFYPVHCPAGCDFCVRVCFDLKGCLYIKVYPGPCTQEIAMPCP